MKSHARGRIAVALGLLALVTSCVMPLSASRTAPGVTVALDSARQFDPSLDIATLLAGSTADSAGPTAAELALAGIGNKADAASSGATVLVPGPAAPSYVFRGRNAQDYLRASLCLTSAIYYEAGNESDEGQRAVAQVVLNRVRHPAYPDTVCGVVYQGTERTDTLCQFTFGCDGSMARIPEAESWSRARRVAQAALAGSVYAPVGFATHYHTLAVNPVWNKALTPAAIVGAHIFYRWPGGAGSPRAFHATYRGNEPVPAPKPKIAPLQPLVDIATLQGVPAPEINDLVAAQTSRNMGETKTASVAPVTGDRRYVPGSLPESDVKPEYRDSGQWINRK